MAVEVERHGSVALVRLALPGGNSIGQAFLDAVSETLGRLEADDAVASVVVTGQGRIFSTGLDLVETWDLDREAMRVFTDRFDGFFVRLRTFAKPVVAAVNGHAIAGGCIIALAADHRVMADAPLKIGINEVVLGIPFPSGAFEVSRDAIAPQAWAECFLAGALLSPERARALGLVQELAAPAAVVPCALEVAASLGAADAFAVRATKADLVAPLLAAVARDRDARRERFLDRWFSEAGSARRAAVRRDLIARKERAGEAQGRPEQS